MIPTSDSISPAWLTEQLNRHGVEGTVSGYDAQQIGTGQIGKCVRYALEYASGTGPASVVAKFPSDDPTSRATGVVLRNFLKEVRFYQELQSRVQIRTPFCYYAEIVDEGPEFAVLMEDLSPAQQGDQLEGCDADVARAAVLELVGLHAPGWCDTSLGELEYLKPGDAADTGVMRELYNSQLPGFLDRYGPELESDEREIIAAVGEAREAPLYRSTPATFSLVHIDYRLDNLLIHRAADGIEVTAVDWQSIGLGAPLNDVAYFLGAGMLPEPRRGVEESIVEAYHERLGAVGVTDFDAAQCWRAYREGTFAGFGVTVIASMLVQRTERGDQMFTAMARRHARHAIDLNGAEFLT